MMLGRHHMRRVHLHAGWFFLFDPRIVAIRLQRTLRHHPGLGQHFGIFDGGLVVQDVSLAAEAFGHMQFFGSEPAIAMPSQTSPFKSIVSTTNVFPSHFPIESPMYDALNPLF